LFLFLTQKQKAREGKSNQESLVKGHTVTLCSLFKIQFHKLSHKLHSLYQMVNMPRPPNVIKTAV